MTRAQIRAARGLLSWSQRVLADRSGVSEATIKRMEAGDAPLQGRYDTVARLRRAFEEAGVVFLSENGGGPGVRLDKHSLANSTKGGDEERTD
ncbi:MAG: helix-turn-helix domain-containing protein [Alphaproteobacteria bacterium]|jgi:transcriptional regulator with XRE-family HTH domain|nr:helix-turn-helix domain-containing protein [Alphaproteobacteria bacterium]